MTLAEQTHQQLLRAEMERIAQEHIRIAKVVGQAAEPLGIERRGRPVAEWLAQVLQALMLRQCERCNEFLLADARADAPAADAGAGASGSEPKIRSPDSS